jgi:hypothetical protein
MCIIKVSVGESGVLKHCLLHYHFIISGLDTVTKQHMTSCVLVFKGFSNLRIKNITYHENYRQLLFINTFTLLIFLHFEWLRLLLFQSDTTKMAIDFSITSYQ